MVTNCLFFYIEYIEMRIQGASYFSEFWNVCDLLHFVVFLAYGIIRLFYEEIG
jgi:hypothetical protein